LQIARLFAAGIPVLLAGVLGVAWLGQSTQAAESKPRTAKEGASLFRANCSPCHGLNAAGGGRGPDLTSGRWMHGSTDAAIFRTIAQGVPGTEMPANGLEDSEIRAIIGYLRSLAPAKHPAISGNPASGKGLFVSAGCANCHMVDGRGGLLGPDLSRVGASRSIAYLIESIRQPDRDLSKGMLDPNNHYAIPLVYDTVTVVKADGETMVGVARNEDTFSIQLLAGDQKLYLFQKGEVKSVLHERRSLMPPYTEDMLSTSQLQNLIAYLETLRGEDSPRENP
jgi:putative heme-binding domain-containing protein